MEVENEKGRRGGGGGGGGGGHSQGLATTSKVPRLTK